MRRCALIFGVCGQDGAYLARFLLERGYTVHGTTRDLGGASFSALEALGVRERVALHAVAPQDAAAVAAVIAAVAPEELYHLAAQSSVGLSFERPAAAFDSILTSTLNILEAMRYRAPAARLFHASSSEVFGDTGPAATETTPLRPGSPYAVAKAAAHWLVAGYRASYGLHAGSGILYSHESPLRPEGFVTRKIIRGAVAVARGEADRLELGNLAVARDWGWAPEYVEAMWRMLQQETADDYILATGRTATLEEFVGLAFAHFGLDWRAHVVRTAASLRPSDVQVSRGDPSKARERLGWSARTRMPELVTRLVEAELAGGHPGVPPLA